MRRLCLASDWDCVKTIFDRVGVATKLQARPQLLHESHTSPRPRHSCYLLVAGLIDNNNVNTRITSLFLVHHLRALPHPMAIVLTKVTKLLTLVCFSDILLLLTPE